MWSWDIFSRRSRHEGGCQAERGHRCGPVVMAALTSSQLLQVLADALCRDLRKGPVACQGSSSLLKTCSLCLRTGPGSSDPHTLASSGTGHFHLLSRSHMPW